MSEIILIAVIYDEMSSKINVFMSKLQEQMQCNQQNNSSNNGDMAILLKSDYLKYVDEKLGSSSQTGHIYNVSVNILSHTHHKIERQSEDKICLNFSWKDESFI